MLRQIGEYMKYDYLVLIIATATYFGCSTKRSAEESGDARTDIRETAFCGDGSCADHENCWTCPEDCQCKCGDGVCTHGEYCALCPNDCDCQTLAVTPPMGWNTWNRFKCDIHEDLVKETAQALVATGMRDLGYVYVNLDDCWQVARDGNGRIIADPERFPSGIKALADYVHALGLRLGIYTCAGRLTCQERPGSYGYELLDMQTYADWGIDYVKVDWCFTEGLNPRERYAIFRDAILATGRPMVLSICNWGLDSPWVWGPHTGHLWRTSMDIFDQWISVLINLEMTLPWAGFATPGHWNDPDMLEVGNGGMSNSEYKALMSLWAMLAAPLIAGNDLRTMDVETAAILTNKEVIAINQDPLGLQAVEVAATVEGGRVLAKPLAYPGLRAVLFFNPTEDTIEMAVTFSDLGLESGPVRITDVWGNADFGEYIDSFHARVEGHSALLLRLQGKEPMPPPGQVYVSSLPFAYAANTVGPVRRDQAAAGDERPLEIAGKMYPHGIGVHGASRILVHLGGKCTRFEAEVGLDASAAPGATVRFEILADGESVYSTPLMKKNNGAIPISLSLERPRYLELRVDAGADDYKGDVADWAEARLDCGQ